MLGLPLKPPPKPGAHFSTGVAGSSASSPEPTLTTWVHDALHWRWRLKSLHGTWKSPKVWSAEAGTPRLRKLYLHGGAGRLQQGLGEGGNSAGAVGTESDLTPGPRLPWKYRAARRSTQPWWSAPSPAGNHGPLQQY